MAWQPIETAPKDGTPILLLSREGFVGFGRMALETIDVGLEQPHTHLREDACWIGKRALHERVEFWMGGAVPSEATHWAPLPPPPGSPDEFVRIPRLQDDGSEI